MAFKNILSNSSGKDSTAMLLLAIERGMEFESVFADTGNESQEVYDYLDYLENNLNIKIRRIKADFTKQLQRKREKTIPEKWVPEWMRGEKEMVTQNIWHEDDDSCGEWVTSLVWTGNYINPMSEAEALDRAAKAIAACEPTGNPFLDLCLWKGRFPSTKARFCTDELKTALMELQVVLPLASAGHTVISWQGVRADESHQRSKLPMTERGEHESLIYRPILNWKWEDCFAMHKRHGIEPNPLYKRGMNRVGCMPCINARKSEVAGIAREFPEEIRRISEWEERVSAASKIGKATMFPVRDAGFPRELHLIDIKQHGINGYVKYAQTARGGKSMDLIEAVNIDEARERRENGEAPICRSAYGLCE